MSLKFEGRALTTLVGTLTGVAGTNTSQPPHLRPLASRFEVCYVTMLLWCWFEDINVVENNSCVDWTGHGKTCVRNHIFHLWSLFKVLYMESELGSLLQKYPQMNSFDLEIFSFRPMPNITNVNFHRTEERHLIKMENNLKMQIKLGLFVFYVCTKQLRYTSCVYDHNVSSSELYFKFRLFRSVIMSSQLIVFIEKCLFWEPIEPQK
jgi:hypothetical protein